MRSALSAFLALTALTHSQTFEGRPALKVGNDRVEVTILPEGATVASIVLKGNADGSNPLWNPKRPGSGMGHFLCLDGFGAPSADEAKGGLQFHGEAFRLLFTTS
ncbi:MAG TPA: hypothetical protein VES20_13675, partial [Bryobacteraceae bacterium]|nr:hypothetical protein [Bryobacteraceae bacterium]